MCLRMSKCLSKQKFLSVSVNSLDREIEGLEIHLFQVPQYVLEMIRESVQYLYLEYNYVLSSIAFISLNRAFGACNSRMRQAGVSKSK